MTLVELLSSANTELHLEQIVHPCYLQEANSELSAENTFGKKLQDFVSIITEKQKHYKVFILKKNFEFDLPTFTISKCVCNNCVKVASFQFQD